MKLSLSHFFAYKKKMEFSCGLTSGILFNFVVYPSKWNLIYLTAEGRKRVTDSNMRLLFKKI